MHACQGTGVAYHPGAVCVSAPRLQVTLCSAPAAPCTLCSDSPRPRNAMLCSVPFRDSQSARTAPNSLPVKDRAEDTLVQEDEEER